MTVTQFISSFFVKTPGYIVTLEAFPSLFAMQGHLGACGVLFSLLWFALASIFIPDLWAHGGLKLVLISGPIILIFFGLLWASFSANNYLAGQIEELHRSSDKDAATAWRETLDRRVRIWMTSLSASYVVICCVLIWLTGGVTSPFTPFYVMIFTLTITKTKISPPGVGKSVLAYYLVAIVFACILAEYLPTPIDGSAIRQSGFQIFMHILFIGASLIVPTVSQYSVERREAKALSAAGGGAHI